MSPLWDTQRKGNGVAEVFACQELLEAHLHVSIMSAISCRVVAFDTVTSYKLHTVTDMLTDMFCFRRERKLPLVPQLGWKKAFYAAGVNFMWFPQASSSKKVELESHFWNLEQFHRRCTSLIPGTWAVEIVPCPDMSLSTCYAVRRKNM